MVDSLPSYAQVYSEKRFQGTQFHIFNYGLSNHSWRVCTATSSKPLLKYYSVTGHESALLCLGDETRVGSMQRRTLKGQPPRYLVELKLPYNFHAFQDIVFLLDPLPIMECSDVDGELLRFHWLRHGSFTNKQVLIRLDEPEKIIATFQPSLIPTKVGSVSFSSTMGDQEMCLILMFLTFSLYARQMAQLR
ncbi:hypothetical protein DSO57_1018134 [Entomophthora muscae]|uniref:Uncharacterized protein n=1 Tax=Entomophthora muscae TaxID=34485 RepID=A0ACC2U2H4_9FUNG|nr:hypothetical protein DSO57_1018134 [Entomophthora muscae]